ncbi:hypothetical protein [Bradyrhizobium valentinum]|uniref:hypothetical protein n=1 Tax=Bradyrhizobium valentinum TaxID=1518501 RepID=UPI0012E3C620|nr:hypothetical protein [Bradyrhizobium valentinum]
MNTIFDLAANAEHKGHFAGTAEAASRAATAAIRLAKLSRILPAVLAADVMPNRDDDLMDLIVTVEADAVNRFAADATNAFALASEVTIPLASGTAARFVVFLDALGVDQVAIIVGKPDFTQPVPVPLHSACVKRTAELSARTSEFVHRTDIAARPAEVRFLGVKQTSPIPFGPAARNSRCGRSAIA